MEQLDLAIFDLSPIAMWIQDYSGVKKIFESWQAQGISNIREYLIENPSRLMPCLATIKTIRINQSTLKLYEADNLEGILESFSKLHFEEITQPQVLFFLGLWEKSPDCVFAPVNYTCTGKQIDVQLRANIITGYEDTWEKILLTTEDISEFQHARRFAESIFTYSPTALWIKDYSKIKHHFANLRQQQVTDLKSYLKLHPDFLQQCFNDIKFLDTNQAMLELFKATDKQMFFKHLPRIFSIHIHQSFSDQLLQLWEGNYYQQRECTYYAIDGRMIHVLEQFNIFPHNTDDWGVIQVALTDITERKFLENHLQYLGKHDILTKLYNRTFYTEEINRLEENSIYPVSCIYLDMNGLKTMNDNYGHDVGDQILKRFGDILSLAITDTPYSVSRIGGDEFVILMPSADDQDVQKMLTKLDLLIFQDNQKTLDFPISVAMGYSTTQNNESIEDLLKRADQTMYVNKNKYYASNSNRRS